MTSKRLTGLDGLRGLAALAVVASHYAEEVAYYGLLGVELFFVISGFVILKTLDRAESVREFALHRFARLYPAYWLSLTIAATFLVVTHQASTWNVAINATMMQHFFNQPDIVSVYWTLAFELWFYIVMAGLYATGQLRHISTVALLWLLAMFALRIGMNYGHGWQLYLQWAPRLFLMPEYGHLFIAGMMICRAISFGWNWEIGAPLFLAVLYSSFGRIDLPTVPPVVYFFVSASLVLAVYFATAKEAAVFASKPLVWSGNRSYSIYLLHVPMLSITQFFFGDDWTLRAAAFVATLICSSVSWSFVEQPSQTCARRISGFLFSAERR